MPKTIKTPLLFFFALAFFVSSSFALLKSDAKAQENGPSHAIAMHGWPLYPEGYNNFAYIDPYAEKGGDLVIGGVGTFDTLNPFTVQGLTPSAQLELGYSVVQLHTVESLMMRGPDEPFTLYGLIAETIETPADRSWVEFKLRPEARFSDGMPITVDDVIFSMETLRDKGRPNTRRYYSLIKEIERPGPGRVRFVFSEKGNAELPLILGLMPILSKEFWGPRDFEKTILEPIIGSGPYMITEIDPGRRITFTRNEAYWGRNLPINQGLNNFDSIRYDYFRDDTSLFEAFKASELSIRVEPSAKTWATGYDFLATRNGQVQQTEIAHSRTADMYGFVFNTRKEIFSDPLIREALILLFDFEWMNENFFHGTYRRLQSYFDNSELGSQNKPASDIERQLLNSFRGEVRDDILERGWLPPRGGDHTLMRQNKRQALALLGEAGWHVVNGQLVNDKSGEPFSFEILLRYPAEEKIALTYAKTLAEVGIEAHVRLVESVQFQLRRESYDFDMLPFTWRGTLSPGNEQAFRFGSKEADIEGTFNVAGVKSRAVDFLIERITNARSRVELVNATRALDRVLLSGFYVIPFHYTNVDRVAYWAEVQIPEVQPLTGMKVKTWWMLPEN